MKKPEEGSRLYNIRHSLAHILAQAVLDMFPDAKLGTGPVTEQGFYYDFDLPRTLIPEDLKILEKKMKKFVQQNQLFVRRDEPVPEAKAFLKKIKQPYKIELIDKFVEQQGVKEVSFYENIREADNKPVFVDLCEGNHVENTKEIDPKSFKLTNLSAAYWQADENNASMQRIYGASFETADELKAWEFMMEEAKKRDHRKLGQQLDLYLISQKVGSGIALLTPKGTVIRQELEKLSREKHLKYGYKYVTTSPVGDLNLYRTSGHYPYYAETMFPPLKDEQDEFMLRPMNCPHHIQLFDSNPRSYRELPFRMREDGLCYRYEQSGELSGLTRVRALTIDDAHIFCTYDQMEEEINRCLDLSEEMYKIFGLNDIAYTLSKRDPNNPDKYAGTDENWERAEDILRQALTKRGIPFEEFEGEAAFYGPKIDVMARDVLGREWQIATVPQIDYHMPEAFDLHYIDANGEKQRPVILHRAVYGSYERFMGLMIEHFAGAFPTWLAPIQVEVIPVAEPHMEYAQALVEELRSHGIRVELSEPSDTLSKRIRNSEMSKIPYMIVVGDKELESGKVNARSYANKKQTEHDKEAFINLLKTEISERRLPEVSEEEKQKLDLIAKGQKEKDKQSADSPRKGKKSFGARKSKVAVDANSHELYDKLIALLDENKAEYRLIDHDPEGRTEVVSPMRGNKVSDAAKCIIMMVKIGKKEKKYVLGVVPGDAKVNLDAIKELYGGSYISFADQETAEELAGSVAGTVLPFAFHDDLELIVDPKLLEIKEIYFNAARLDRSMALRTSDYEKIAQPRLEDIALYS